MVYFCIVTRDDGLIYDKDIDLADKIRVNAIAQFVVHASLDMVDIKSDLCSDMFLGKVDEFGAYHISAFVTATRTRFLLLFDPSLLSENAISAFFNGARTLFAKARQNPFYADGEVLASDWFDAEIAKCANATLK